jgi:hypothetical protein
MRSALACCEMNELSVHDTMASPSVSCVLIEPEQIQVLNDVLDDENTGEFSSDNDSVFDSDYTQLVTLETHDFDSENGVKKICVAKYWLSSCIMRNIL